MLGVFCKNGPEEKEDKFKRIRKTPANLENGSNRSLNQSDFHGFTLLRRSSRLKGRSSEPINVTRYSEKEAAETYCIFPLVSLSQALGCAVRCSILFRSERNRLESAKETWNDWKRVFS